MAIRLKKTINGLDHNYWVVEQHQNCRKKNKRTEIILNLFTSKEARAAGQDPVYRERFKWDLQGVDKLGAEVYAHVKLSRKERKPVEGAQPDESGSIETVEVEMNEFVTAEDEI